MRNLHIPSRSPSYSKNAMVATSHPDATRKALDIMTNGGNAFDAAVSAAAVLSVVEAHSTGIGGDCFCLFYSNSERKVRALNGSGYYPSKIDYKNIKLTEQKNLDPYTAQAVTIPGAVSAWDKLIKDYGNLTLQQVLQPAIEFADEGYIVADVIADMWEREKNKLNNDEDCKRIFLKDGKPFEAGDVHYQPELAETLRIIAKHGRDGFYNGKVAEDILLKLQLLGGNHTLNDFLNFEARYEMPISTNYRGFDVYECPPNGQGIVALLMLNILSHFDLSKFGHNDFERLHLEAEVSKIGFYHRNKYLGDPEFSKIPVDKILSEDYAKKLSKLIKFKSTLNNYKIIDMPNNKDTVYISVVDKEGNFVSLINSIFHPFGSGLVTPNTGILLHNRGSSFNLIKGHPNYLEPNKKPMHTIIPGLMLKNNNPLMAFGVMGAHYQPVGQVHFLTNVLDYGMDVQLALDHPRSFCYDGILSLEKTIQLETSVKLKNLGHKVEFADLPHGGGQAIMKKANNILVGGSDPRKDGIALGN